MTAARSPRALFCALVIVAAAANMLRTILHAPEAVQPWDFICFWTAGHAWSLGASPYDMTLAVNAVPEGFTQWPFVYPPAARVLFEPFGRLPFALSWALYKIAQTACWGAACWLVARRVGAPGGTLAPTAALAGYLGFVSYPALASTASGQVVAFLVLALARLLALPEGRGAWARTALILVVLSLKPQLGLPLAVVIVARWADWRAVVAASVVLGALTLWGCLGRPDLILPEFAANLALYGEQGPNGVFKTSGLPLMLALAGLPWPTGAWPALLSLVPAALVAASRLPRERALLVATVSLLLVQPNHEHGYLLLIAFVPTVLAAPRAFRTAFLACGAGFALSVPLGLALGPAGPAGLFLGPVIDAACIAVLFGATIRWLSWKPSAARQPVAASEAAPA